MKSIIELAKKYNTDKKQDDGTPSCNNMAGHGYATHYDEILKNHDVNKMLEIGVSWGSSIKMWDEYYNKEVKIYGIDIKQTRFEKQQLDSNSVKIFIGDSSDPNFLSKFKSDVFDLIIDDGSHQMKDQQVALDILFNNLRSGGIYVIEDLHTSRIPKFIENKNETPTLDVLKLMKLGDVPKSKYISHPRLKELLKQIDSMKFYENDKICFITKC